MLLALMEIGRDVHDIMIDIASLQQKIFATLRGLD